MEQEEESKTIMLRGLSLHVTEEDVSLSFSMSLTWCKDILRDYIDRSSTSGLFYSLTQDICSGVEVYSTVFELLVAPAEVQRSV